MKLTEMSERLCAPEIGKQVDSMEFGWRETENLGSHDGITSWSRGWFQ
jgi:hypothetical protein